jgi:hypothetical protein
MQPAYALRQPTPFDPTIGIPSSLSDPRRQELMRTPLTSPVIKTIEQPPSVGNLRLSLSEQFLNRFVARDELKPGEVRGFILGAQVTGRQTTKTRLTLDVVPDADKIHAMLVLNGKTRSETTGITPQAKIETMSDQDFVATKEIFFDGMKLSTRHAIVHARANNQTVGAMTPYSGTLIGSLADRIAYREAERRRPQSEQIARDKLVERVYPEFDSSIDHQLAMANDRLNDVVRPKLREWNMLPSVQKVASSGSHLFYCVQLGGKTEPATNPDSRLVTDDDINLLVHESLFSLIVDRFSIRGLKTTDREIKAMFTPYEYKLEGDELDRAEPPAIGLPGMSQIVTDIEFDETNPLEIRFEEDRVMVTMRATFKPAGQTLLPHLAITIPYTIRLTQDKLIAVPGKPHVACAKSEDETAATGVAIGLVKQGIESTLFALGFDRAVPASVWPVGGTVPRIAGVRFRDGWASVSVD